MIVMPPKSAHYEVFAACSEHPGFTGIRAHHLLHEPLLALQFHIDASKTACFLKLASSEQLTSDTPSSWSTNCALPKSVDIGAA